ncbi:MAG: hypothetical protein DI539_28645 [Flavobacterium psychrophilum]|nr:MAG: hypothetical protein DI539_28645 [Flavobacterium psychrophilum]
MHAGAHVLLVSDHEPQLPNPEHTKERCSWISPSWPVGQVRVRLSGPGQGMQVLLVSVHGPAVIVPAHAS